MTKGSQILKKFRLAKGLTQTDVEKATGVPRSTIACIESLETYTTSVTTAKTLGKYVNIPWFLFFVEGGDNADAINSQRGCRDAESEQKLRV